MAAMSKSKSLCWIVALGFVVAACGPSGSENARPAAPFTPGSGGAGGGNKGGNNGVTDGGVGVGGDPFELSFPDALAPTDAVGLVGDKENPKDALEACGATAFRLERNPPEVVLVLDRSGSMRRTTEGGTPAVGMVDRWSYTTTAVNAVIMATEDNVRWGMKMYPTCTPQERTEQHKASDLFPCSPNPCSIEGGYTAPDVGRFQTISTAVVAAGEKLVQDFGATPTGNAVKDATQKILASGRNAPKYLLLATDGTPNCMATPANPVDHTWRADFGHDSAAQIKYAVDAVQAAHDAGVPVFVLGIAISNTTTNMDLLRAHSALNQMATAGGRPRDDANLKYYSATNEAALKAALSEIAAATVSCDLPLGQGPPENAQTRVDIDDAQVAEDAAEGWSWTTPDRKSITLNGALCGKLKRGELKKTVISFGCPGKPVPPPPPIL